MQTEPEYSPPSPDAVKGECQVAGSSSSHTFTVNLDRMECDCTHGAPWRWDNRRWKPASLCTHKLKAVASLCERDPKDIVLRDYYDEQVGRRFNAFNAVSAMHKEIRRGDVEAALYWATVMIPHRGKHGVVNYLRNILFEETRDLPLAKYILKLSTYGRNVSLLDMQRAVNLFCIAPKKWELSWRHDIFINEMRGYKKLAGVYGYEVAKGKDIIEHNAVAVLEADFLQGFALARRDIMQTGLKGWFKSKSDDHDHMKLDIFNALVDVMNGDKPNKFVCDDSYVQDVYSFLMRRMRIVGGVGYHELNVFADALSGEPGNDPACRPSMLKYKAAVNYPKVRRIPLGDLRNLPLYSHDNHTWAGKAKMRQHPTQLEPGADQTDLDFRLCGAYMGVAWRTLAYKQHATIDCKWGDVSWKKPNWLWSHLDSMWY